MRVATDNEKIYIQKLIPDLGVFDIAEKYFAENPDKTESTNKLFTKNNMTGLRFMANNFSTVEPSEPYPEFSGIFYKITDKIAIFIFETRATISNTDSYFVRF